jgi:hypothetical protein
MAAAQEHQRSLHEDEEGTDASAWMLNDASRSPDCVLFQPTPLLIPKPQSPGVNESSGTTQLTTAGLGVEVNVAAVAASNETLSRTVPVRNETPVVDESASSQPETRPLISIPNHDSHFEETEQQRGVLNLFDPDRVTPLRGQHQHIAEEQLGSQLHHSRMPSTIQETDYEMDDEVTNTDTNDKAHPLISLSPRRSSYSSSELTSLLDRQEHVAYAGETSTAAYRQSPPSSPPSSPGLKRSSSRRDYSHDDDGMFVPVYATTKAFGRISKHVLSAQHVSPFAAATWIGFWALLLVTCANYVLTPMRDAIALQIGVQHMPKLTLASTVMAFCSSVPIGWLFEAPDPGRRRVWKRMGLTRGETQGSSLALFYRCFAIILISYAAGFALTEWLRQHHDTPLHDATQSVPSSMKESFRTWWPEFFFLQRSLWLYLGQGLYIAFFLVVHLMKLHSLSLVWGVTTEAMEYEEVARKRNTTMESSKTRIQRLALVGFGGTMGGILGSAMASSMARLLKLPGLLLLAAFLLEISAELSIELGRIMQKHWEEQQLFQSTNDLASLDASMKRSSSLGSMKRVASGNSLNRVKSASELSKANGGSSTTSETEEEKPLVNGDTFVQRLLRGITTILRSRLLMAIFTYNALYASTTVLLSFQRAALVANRNDSTTTEADTAFLANVNMASSVAIFALQASGVGAYMAQACGPRKTLALMPLIRLLGVLALAWWHHTSNGQPPNLLVFLVVDECTKIMNLAVAKPVRESLWHGLSNEARYEAKPIVDTLANRWGGGSAAFLVSFINKMLDLLGVEPDGEGGCMIFGFPPILFLCMLIATWWTVVSADLGTIRRRIDAELKKRQ